MKIPVARLHKTSMKWARTIEIISIFFYFWFFTNSYWYLLGLYYFDSKIETFFTKKFKLKSNTPNINKLNAKLSTVINWGGSSDDILNIENQIKESTDEDIVQSLRSERTTVFWKMRGQAKRSWIWKMPRKVIMRLFS